MLNITVWKRNSFFRFRGLIYRWYFRANVNHRDRSCLKATIISLVKSFHLSPLSLYLGDNLGACLRGGNLLQVELSLFKSPGVDKVFSLHHEFHIGGAPRGLVLSRDFIVRVPAAPRCFPEIRQVVYRILWLLDVFKNPIVELVEVDSLLKGCFVHFCMVFVFHSLAVIH